MRKEYLIFSLSVASSVYFFGTISIVGLFIWGFAWLTWSDD